MKVNWLVLIALLGCIVLFGMAVTKVLGGYDPVVSLLGGVCIGFLFNAFGFHVLEVK